MKAIRMFVELVLCIIFLMWASSASPSGQPILIGVGDIFGGIVLFEILGKLQDEDEEALKTTWVLLLSGYLIGVIWTLRFMTGHSYFLVGQFFCLLGVAIILGWWLVFDWPAHTYDHSSPYGEDFD